MILKINRSFKEDESGELETRESYSESSSDDSENTDKQWRWYGCSSEEDGICSLNDRLGYLYFRYFERSTPYTRVPLMDKVPFF